jgi:hypothetical protein
MSGLDDAADEDVYKMIKMIKQTDGGETRSPAEPL